MIEINEPEPLPMTYFPPKWRQAAVYIRCNCGGIFIGTNTMQEAAKEFIIYHRFCQLKNKDKDND